jgi:hypothetical protein
VLCIICYIFVLTQYFAATIDRRVEEKPRACARGPTVSAFQHRCCVCCRRKTPREGMSRYQLFSINYYQFVTLSLLHACFGDGVVDHGSYVRRRTSPSTSSSNCSSCAANSATEERDRQRDEMVQSHKHI